MISLCWESLAACLLARAKKDYRKRTEALLPRSTEALPPHSNTKNAAAWSCRGPDRAPPRECGSSSREERRAAVSQTCWRRGALSGQPSAIGAPARHDAHQTAWPHGAQKHTVFPGK